MEINDKIKLATFGGGCFWCLEAMFQQLKGVVAIEPGYSGGKIINPTYKEVCSGTTGHAEVFQIKFDDSIISYNELLEVFWTVHDPTTLNRQGNDVGSQYRSVIFNHDQDQLKVATNSKQSVAKELWEEPIVTEITKLEVFYPAEIYHKDYYTQNQGNAYCSAVINPKIAKFRKRFLSKLK